ncbi:hypothetical protein D9757_013414 [Collybiopsis confluens]|uniref:BED-type domain-containing protein n=1 Tax=Collybiopsis confluens TaxID=2823264 RepID=A0A8H5FSU3_9AGAR|nr:hypothetical protein D9757_013414 [Collybiopsis confluens]
MPNGALQTTFHIQLGAPPAQGTQNRNRRDTSSGEENIEEAPSTARATRATNRRTNRARTGTASQARRPAAQALEQELQRNGTSPPATPPPRQQRGVTVHFADESPGEVFDFSGLSPETPLRAHDLRTSDHSDIVTSLMTPTHVGPQQTPSRISQHQTPESVRRTPHARPPALGRSPFQRIYRPRAGAHGGHRAADVWTFFTEIEGKSICHFCRKLMEGGKPVPFHEYGQQTGTDGRRQHLIKNHHDEWIESCITLDIALTAGPAKVALQDYQSRKGLAEPSVPFTSTSQSLPHGPFSKEAFVDSLMIWIVADDQSLNVVESWHFRNMLLQLRSQLKESDIPHRHTLRTRILESVDEYWNEIAKEMQSAEGTVSITDDIWTDLEKRAFLAITGHWISAKIIKTSTGEKKELTMHSALIGFVRLPGSHTGHHISEAFVSVMNRLGLLNKIGWITSDNASNNDTFMACLSQSLRAHRPDFIWDPRERRIRCFAHIVNLACKALLAELEGMGHQALPRLRQLVKTIRGSNLRRDHFIHCVKQIMQKELQLILDMDIRWSSTYLMVERGIILRLANLARTHFLSDEDWALLIEMKNALEVPHLFQQCLSSEKTPTLCDAIPAFEAMAAKWLDLQDTSPRLSAALRAGLDKLNEYIYLIRPIPAYTLAMAINPVMKLDFYQIFQPDQFFNAKNVFINALATYSATEDAQVRLQASSSITETIQSWADRMLRGSTDSSSSAKWSLTEEVDQYLAEHSSATSSIVYWQEHCTRYPTIYKLAMDVLPIQGTSVPSERVFSSAGETNTKRRSRISPEMMQALQVLKFGIKSRGSLNFTAGLTQEEQLQYLESVTEDRFTVPSDMRAYIDSLHCCE